MESKLFHQILQPVTMEGRQIKKSFKLLSGHVCLESLKFCVLHCRRADEDGKQDVPVPAASEEARPSVSSFKLLSGHVPKVLFLHCRHVDEKQDVRPDPAASDDGRPSNQKEFQVALRTCMFGEPKVLCFALQACGWGWKARCSSSCSQWGSKASNQNDSN